MIGSMPSSDSASRSRLAWLLLATLPVWACATAIDNAPTESSPLQNIGSGGELSAGDSGSAGKNSAAGSGASGAPGSSGGAPSSSGGGNAGRGGASSGGTGTGSAGKGGTSSSAGSAGKGGTSSAGGSAGKGGTSSAGGAGAGAPSAGAPSAGAPGAAGSTGSTTCDAAHSVATLISNQPYTGKANDCVRLAVNPSWSTVAVQLQPMPGTGPYPVPFSFFSCGGNGTGSLTADYVNVMLKSGPNPGCDFFVQFNGGAATIKVTYYN